MEKRCKILDTGRKDANIQIGKRLREARLNMNLEKSEIADVLDVTVEHYRKLEAGISVDKVLTLYHKYGIDPTYLITGESSMKDFNLDYYVANSTKEQRNDFFDRVLAYLSKLIR
jgi:transcriptional regulator with XRE-family HTH domain